MTLSYTRVQRQTILFAGKLRSRLPDVSIVLAIHEAGSGSTKALDNRTHLGWDSGNDAALARLFRLSNGYFREREYCLTSIFINLLRRQSRKVIVDHDYEQLGTVGKWKNAPLAPTLEKANKMSNRWR